MFQGILLAFYFCFGYISEFFLCALPQGFNTRGTIFFGFGWLWAARYRVIGSFPHRLRVLFPSAFPSEREIPYFTENVIWREFRGASLVPSLVPSLWHPSLSAIIINRVVYKKNCSNWCYPLIDNTLIHNNIRLLIPNTFSVFLVKWNYRLHNFAHVTCNNN